MNGKGCEYRNSPLTYIVHEMHIMNYCTFCMFQVKQHLDLVTLTMTHQLLMRGLIRTV